MYNELAEVLKNTRSTLKDACISLGINTQEVELEELEVTACDNCGIWLNPKYMAHDADGTVMCHFCHGLDILRF